MDHAADLLALLAPDGRILQINPAAMSLLGHAPGALCGTGLFDHVPADDHAALRAALQVAGPATRACRHRFRHRAGHEVWLETLATALHADAGDPGRVTAVVTSSRSAGAAIAAEQQHRVAEERLRVALLTEGLGLYDIRLPSREGYYSPEYLRIYGYAPEHAVWFSSGWEPLVHPADAATIGECRQQILAGQRDSFDVEARRMHRDGRWILVRSVGVAIDQDADGRPRRLVSTLRDIDRQRRDEQALRESRARLQHAQEIARLGDWRVDGATMRHRWSDEAFRLAGYEPGECEPSLRAFLDRVHTDDVERLSATARRLETQWQDVDEQARVVLPDGRVRCLQLQIRVARDAAGRPTGLTGTVQDVTEREQAQAALRDSAAELARAQRIAQVGSWVWHLDTDRATRSAEYSRILGIDPSEPEMTFGAHARFATPATWPRLEAAVRRAVADGTPYEVELEIVREDGATRWIMVRGEPAREADGTVKRLFGTIQDITERKRAEIDLRQARDQVRELSSHREDELDQERKRIALDVHDEVGQMLTAMKLQLDMLQSHTGDARAVEVAAERLRGLVEDTIEVTRNVALNLRPAALDLGLVPALEWLAEDFTLRSEIPCRLQAATGEVALGEKAATELFRIAQESLTNIARHARASRVGITLQRVDGALMMSIRDDGCGFDPLRARSLGRFGLLGMRERALRLDASLLIDSRPGEGTTVSIQLPTSRAPGAAS